MIASQCGKLEEGIEIHELNARLLIHHFLWHKFEVFLHRPFRMRVTIAIWIAEDATILAYNHEVAAPSVDTNRSHLNAFVCHHLQATNHLVVECINVPKEMTSRLNNVVGKSSQFTLF